VSLKREEEKLIQLFMEEKKKKKYTSKDVVLLFPHTTYTHRGIKREKERERGREGES
jgi:cellobiose-specific phosphotransferase system component IIB